MAGQSRLGERLGHDIDDLTRANEAGAELVDEVRGSLGGEVPLVVSGCVGPRGDGYASGSTMTALQAADYHAQQVEDFAGSAADLVSALTLTDVAEAVGFVRAAGAAGMPAVVSSPSRPTDGCRTAHRSGTRSEPSTTPPPELRPTSW